MIVKLFKLLYYFGVGLLVGSIMGGVGLPFYAMIVIVAIFVWASVLSTNP